jgi:DNA-binding response OmpR family regulator
VADVDEYTLVLVVEPHDETLGDMLGALRRAGFPAVGVRTFEHAREQITIDPPLVLVTQARLGSYSGLHLAYVARQRRSTCQVIVLADLPDASLERDALQAGAVILGRPLAALALPPVLSMLLGRGAPIPTVTDQTMERRRIERRQVVIPGYTPERRVADRRRSAWSPTS